MDTVKIRPIGARTFELLSRSGPVHAAWLEDTLFVRVEVDEGHPPPSAGEVAGWMEPHAGSVHVFECPALPFEVEREGSWVLFVGVPRERVVAEVVEATVVVALKDERGVDLGTLRVSERDSGPSQRLGRKLDDEPNLAADCVRETKEAVRRWVGSHPLGGGEYEYDVPVSRDWGETIRR